jgi:hypothetical protein
VQDDLLDRSGTPKRRKRPPAAEVTPETPIWCPWCEEEHPASAFNKETRRFSGLSVICRQAQAEKRKLPQEREKNQARNRRRWADPAYRERSIAASRARRKIKGQDDLRRARRRLQRVVDEWKRQGCVDCGYRDIRAIDPDHLLSAAKAGHLSRLVQLCVSMDRLTRELASCVPRCARCHRLVTQQQRFSRNRGADRLPPSWQRRIDMQDANDSIKVARGCADCGWARWARGLDWDHVRGPKVATIAIMIGRRDSWQAIEDEMAKCEVVCANCHRVRTHERRLAVSGENLNKGSGDLGPTQRPSPY